MGTWDCSPLFTFCGYRWMEVVNDIHVCSLYLCLPVPAAALRALWAGAIEGAEQGSAVFWPLWADRLSGTGSMRLLAYS